MTPELKKLGLLVLVITQLSGVRTEDSAPVVAVNPAPALDPAAAEESTRRAWFQAVPHNASGDLLSAVSQAAWFPESDSNAASMSGIVMLTQGNYHSLHELLPRWLDSLASTRDGDLTPHVIVAALGFSALEACQQHTYSHHCVLEHNWPGPDKQYDFATPWYEAVTLSKVELLWQILGMGVSVLWLDTDIVNMGSPMPHLAQLEADLAVSAENCHSQLLPPADCEDCGPNTGVLYLKNGWPAMRLVTEWLNLQRRHLLDWAYDPNYLHRRSDQVTLTKYALPAALMTTQPGGAYLNATMLSPALFPNHCGGECGCDGAEQRPASRFLRHENQKGHLTTGRVTCPRKVVNAWLLYHVPCARSTHEKLALIDAYQGLHNTVRFRVEGRVAHARRHN